MLDTERELADLNEHVLLAVVIRYGKSNVEYGMAGGVPKNQRRRGLRGETSIASTESSTKLTAVNGNGSKNGKKAAATSN